MFWILFTNCVLTSLFYNIFVSTDRQSWDHKNEDADENTEEIEIKLTSSDVKESIKSSTTRVV